MGDLESMADSKDEVVEGAKKRHKNSFLLIELLIAAALLLTYLWIHSGPAPITGQQVFGGGDLTVRPARSGDASHISGRWVRAAMDRDASRDYSESPRLILFGLGRVTLHSLTDPTPNSDRLAWVGVYRVPFSALFFGCPQYPQTPAPPKPSENSFNIAIFIDPVSGKATRWVDYSTAGPYMTWACATGNGRL